MALILVTGGTTRSANGTLVSVSNKVTFSGIGATTTLHYRDEGDFYSDDLTLTTAATGLTFSVGATWYTAASLPAQTTTAVNQVLYVKQGGYAAASGSSFTTTGLFDTAHAEAPVISGTLTATITGTTTATIVGPTATGTITKWQYQIGAGSWVDVASTSGTFPSTNITGLTANTAYTFGVRAVNDTAVSETRSSASVTTHEASFSDAFSNSSLDARWATLTTSPGTVTETTSLAISSTDSGRALVYLKNFIAKESSVYTVKGTRDTSGNLMCYMVVSRIHPSTGIDPRIFVYQAQYGDFGILYNHPTNGLYYWSGALNQWQTTGAEALTATANTVYSVKLTVTSTTFKVGIYNSSDTLLEETSTVNWSDAKLSGDAFLCFGDHWEGYYSGGMTISLASKA